ncbi:MAG: hypothetical protein WAR24_24215 [Candidatus Acidiferrales bacterium]
MRVFETAQLDFEGAAESLDRPREDDRTAGRILAKDLQAEFRGEFSNARDVVRMAPMRPREFFSGQVVAFLGQSSSKLVNVGILAGFRAPAQQDGHLDSLVGIGGASDSLKVRDCGFGTDR